MYANNSTVNVADILLLTVSLCGCDFLTVVECKDQYLAQLKLS